jgi:hypothetical protein
MWYSILNHNKSTWEPCFAPLNGLRSLCTCERSVQEGLASRPTATSPNIQAAYDCTAGSCSWGCRVLSILCPLANDGLMSIGCAGKGSKDVLDKVKPVWKQLVPGSMRIFFFLNGACPCNMCVCLKLKMRYKLQLTLDFHPEFYFAFHGLCHGGCPLVLIRCTARKSLITNLASSPRSTGKICLLLIQIIRGPSSTAKA